MSTTTAKKPTRKNWTIMLSGLYANMFKRDNHYMTLRRWVDLEEEVSNL